MASHFKQPDSADGAPRAATGAGRASGRHMSLNTPRGGEESYHAPQGNPHAAGTPHSSEARFIPVVSARPTRTTSPVVAAETPGSVPGA